MVGGIGAAISGTGDVHFVTFSCFHRLGYLETAAARDLFEDAPQKAHLRYRFDVIGDVVMPEHVHLLVSEPRSDLLERGVAGVEAFRSEASPEETLLARTLL